jgi:hypothetical protein
MSGCAAGYMVLRSARTDGVQFLSPFKPNLSRERRVAYHVIMSARNRHAAGWRSKTAQQAYGQPQGDAQVWHSRPCTPTWGSDLSDMSEPQPHVLQATPKQFILQQGRTDTPACEACTCMHAAA